MEIWIHSKNRPNKILYKRIKWLGCLILAITLLWPTGNVWAQKKIKISIATGGTGGVFYPYGGIMANVISKYLSDVEATAEVTNASLDNTKLIGAKKVEMAFIFADMVYEGYIGKPPLFKEKIPIRTIASLYHSNTHIVCLDGKGIDHVKDLRGRRISTGAPGSGSEIIALRILEAYGMDPNKDVKRDRLSVAESVGALKDGKIEAFFWTGGLPTAAILDLSATPGMKIKLLPSGDAIPKISEKYGPIYFKATCPPNIYRGVNYEVSTVGGSNLLVCLASFDENLVYQITKVLFDHKADLVAGHKTAEELDLKAAVIGSPVPFHSGAIRFYKEKGVKAKF